MRARMEVKVNQDVGCHGGAFYPSNGWNFPSNGGKVLSNGVETWPEVEIELRQDVSHCMEVAILDYHP